MKDSIGKFAFIDCQKVLPVQYQFDFNKKKSDKWYLKVFQYNVKLEQKPSDYIIVHL